VSNLPQVLSKELLLYLLKEPFSLYYLLPFLQFKVWLKFVVLLVLLTLLNLLPMKLKSPDLKLLKCTLISQS